MGYILSDTLPCKTAGRVYISFYSHNEGEPLIGFGSATWLHICLLPFAAL